MQAMALPMHTIHVPKMKIKYIVIMAKHRYDLRMYINLALLLCEIFTMMLWGSMQFSSLQFPFQPFAYI